MNMVKSDVLTGILVGVILGLTFTAPLTPHLGLIVILTVIFGAKMISVK